MNDEYRNYNQENEKSPEPKEQNITVKLEHEAGTFSMKAEEKEIPEITGKMPEIEVSVKQGENETAPSLKADASDAADQFAGLPIESLICKPIIAAAQGQQELTAVYIDGLKKLAYSEDGKTNTLDFSYKRPVIKQDGTMSTQDCEIKAPLISLVPVPAFTMDELTVDFTMEVKNMEMSDSKTHTDVSSTVKYHSWFGLDASITGNVSSDSQHKRQTDSTASYKIHARAVQQPPSEGMAKLTSLFAQAMEPINNQS